MTTYNHRHLCPTLGDLKGGGSEPESSLYGSGLKVVETSTGA